MSNWQANVKAGLVFAKLLAELTTSQWDDEAVGLLTTLVDNESFISFINGLLNQKAAGTLDVKSPTFSMDAEQLASPELKEAVSAAGFDWAAFIDKMLPIILKMIALFANK